MAPKHSSSLRTMLVPCGYQHSSRRPRRGWHESRCRWLSSAGSAGASQSARPRRGWRWARRPPRMLHHEEMSAPAPLLPACQPVLHPCRREGPWSDRAQKPSIRSAAEESRRVEAPHRIPPVGPGPAARGFCCSRSEAQTRVAKSSSAPQARQAGANAGSRGWLAFCWSPGSAAIPPGLCRSSSHCSDSPRSRAHQPPLGFWQTSPGFTYHLEQAKRFGLQHHRWGALSPTQGGRRGLTTQHRVPTTQRCPSPVKAETLEG